MNTGQRSVFDTAEALQIVQARQAAVESLLTSLKQNLGLRTAVDVGCGVGHFSVFLRDIGFDIIGIDGREQNVAVARSRYPDINFLSRDVADKSFSQIGSFDLVFCMGLLYHLENPLLAIRQLRAVTGTCVLIESMCFPDESPWMQLREEPRYDNQSLTDVAFYPSEGCLIKMLYRAGYSSVYRLATLPDHEDFRETQSHRRRRTVLLASHDPIESPLLLPKAEPPDPGDPWQKLPPRKHVLAHRVADFLRKPLHEKSLSIYARWKKLFPAIPFPVRLPFGAWFVGRNDYLGSTLIFNGFEPGERAFVQRFLRPGMTVLDIGAHHGFYTLLASILVGSTGKVFAFEPSPRERKALRLNLKLNGRKNVCIQEAALGPEKSQGTLYVAERQTGCNSLRPPAVSDATSSVRVQVIRLDDFLRGTGIERVDFIKLDVEGAELSILEGATELLRRHPRPVILAEIEDIRTAAWGYRASEIVTALGDLEYQWFQPQLDGTLLPIGPEREGFQANLVAIPKERREEVISRTNPTC